MQSLLLIRSGSVSVCNRDTSYHDTYENYLTDGGEALPSGLTLVDVNLSVGSAIVGEGESTELACEYATRVIAKVGELHAAFDARKKIFDDAYVDARLERQQKEAEEEAKRQEEERYQKLTLEEYKAERLVDLGRVVAPFEDNINKDMYFTSSLGFKCNGDRRTRDNLQDLITFFDLQAQDGTILYRDYDNVDRNLTKEQVQTLLTEHVTNGQNLYKQKWKYEKEIEAAVDKDSLKKMEFTFTMSDFTGRSLGA